MEESKALKIGVVCYPTYGGSGVIATELGSYLAKKGSELHFITSSAPVRLDLFAPNVFFHEVSVKQYPLFKYDPYEIALTSKIVDIVLHEGLDVLHVHYAIPHASAAVLAKNILASQGIYLPIVTTLHGTDITLVGKDPAFAPVIKYSIESSDVVTAVSESLKQSTVDHFKVDKSIEVVPNFVCVDNYKKHLSKECQKIKFAPNGERVIIHISNFRKVKRIEDIIEAFDIVNKVEHFKLLLVGDGPERSGIEYLVRQKGLMDKVVFLGAIKEVEDALCAADLFVLASEHESFGLVALEAMAAVVPVVSTNSGGIPEVNIHGETGFTCDVGDVKTMAEHIINALDPDCYNKLKANAFRRAEAFDIRNIAPRYEKLYQKAMKS